MPCHFEETWPLVLGLEENMTQQPPLPPGFPYRWCCDWGEDRFGIWAAFKVDGVRQGLRWVRPGVFVMGSPADEVGI